MSRGPVKGCQSRSEARSFLAVAVKRRAAAAFGTNWRRVMEDRPTPKSSALLSSGPDVTKGTNDSFQLVYRRKEKLYIVHANRVASHAGPLVKNRRSSLGFDAIIPLRMALALARACACLLCIGS